MCGLLATAIPFYITDLSRWWRPEANLCGCWNMTIHRKCKHLCNKRNSAWPGLALLSRPPRCGNMARSIWWRVLARMCWGQPDGTGEGDLAVEVCISVSMTPRPSPGDFCCFSLDNQPEVRLWRGQLLNRGFETLSGQMGAGSWVEVGADGRVSASVPRLTVFAQCPWAIANQVVAHDGPRDCSLLSKDVGGKT